MKILVTPTSFQKNEEFKAKLQEFATEVVYNPYKRPLKAEEVIELLEGVDGYIAGLDYITEDVIKNAPASLKVISRYGAGVDRVDIDAATKKGIIVTNTPGVNAQGVAELALTLMLSVARKVPILDKKVRNGEWPRSTGVELFKKTLGIVGLGAIGKALARAAQGLAMQALAYDPYLDIAYVKENGIKGVTFDELIANSDVISLHLPLNKNTQNIINTEVIQKMKSSAIIINTSRGGLIDEEAAYDALKNGKLGGLGIDTFAIEPPEASPFFELENVVVTPHTGAHTFEAINNMGMLAVQNLIDVVCKKDCRYVVNKSNG